MSEKRLTVPVPPEHLKAFTAEQQKLLAPMVQNVNVAVGGQPVTPPLKLLPPGATLADVIRKVNEWLTRVQA